MLRLRRSFIVTLLSLGLLLIFCGCERFSGFDLYSAASEVIGEVFAPYTVTVPVLVTPRPTGTELPQPSKTPLPTETPKATSTMTSTPIVFPTATFSDLDLSLIPEASGEKFELVKDVTIPDGTVLLPGELFIKVFRLKNTGQSVWSEGMKVYIRSNGELTTPSLVNAVFLKPDDLIEFSIGSWGIMTYNVAPGETVDLVLLLQAPVERGEYQIDFQLVFPGMERIHTPLWLRFNVDAELTPIPTETLGEQTVQTVTPTAAAADWNGIWMIRDPKESSAEEIHPLTAWIYEDDDLLKGFFYDSVGEPVIISGSLKDGGRTFSGIYNYPWMPYPTSVTWRLSETGGQFMAITDDGVLQNGVICGARGKEPFPRPCVIKP